MHEDEIFDRQGMLVQPEDSVGYTRPLKLVFRILRPSGQVTLRTEHVRELHSALASWIDRIDKMPAKPTSSEDPEIRTCERRGCNHPRLVHPHDGECAVDNCNCESFVRRFV